jgi:hypothetical protein
MRFLRSLLTCAMLGAAFAALGPASASAAPTAAGTWSCCGAGGAAQQTWAITESGGSLSGTAGDPEPFSPISGKISGTSVEIVTGPYTGSSYSATFTGTISGEAMSGTWRSNASQEGTWTATRGSGAPTGSEEEERAAAKRKEEEQAGKRKSAVQVNCETLQPSIPGEYFHCTAQVGDASGRSPAQRPTGTVAFTIGAGGAGAFRGSSTCTLAPSQTGGASSFCAVDYLPPLLGWIPVGSQPPIAASYSGDSVFAGASGQPQGPISTGNPLSPEAVFQALCVEAFAPACQGIVPPPPGLADACFSFAPCDSGASASDEGEETITVGATTDDLVANAACPPASTGVSSGPLTECELRTYLESDDPDPDLKAKVAYEKAYNTYKNFADKQRISTLEDFQKSLEGDGEANAAGIQANNTISLLWTKYITQAFNEAAQRGTNNSEPLVLRDDSCKSDQCKAWLEDVNRLVAESLQKVLEKKAELKVNVPFVPSKTRNAGKADIASMAKRHETHPARKLVLASSGTVTLASGTKTKLRLPISALVREKLRYARQDGVKTLTAHLVVEVSTGSGASEIRTIPIKVELVAKKPRRVSKKKKK